MSAPTVLHTIKKSLEVANESGDIADTLWTVGSMSETLFDYIDRQIEAAEASPTETRLSHTDLNFYLEKRHGIWVLEWYAGGCRPAEESELKLMQLLLKSKPQCATMGLLGNDPQRLLMERQHG